LAITKAANGSKKSYEFEIFFFQFVFVKEKTLNTLQNNTIENFLLRTKTSKVSERVHREKNVHRNLQTILPTFFLTLH